MSDLIANQIYDGRLFDPVTQAAFAAIDTLAARAHGTVEVGMYKGNLMFLAMRDVPHSLYNEADSSMEESDGLNPASSQGFLEVQSVEALTMAKAGQIVDLLGAALKAND
jgi:argininosuccinate synthase